MALRRRGRERTVDYWPGFVDALSTLLLAIMFLLTVFVLGQFILSREISGKDEVLDRLNNQINELTQLLALEKSGKQDLEDSFANLQSQLSTAEGERSRLQALLNQGTGTADSDKQKIGTLTGELYASISSFREIVSGKDFANLAKEVEEDYPYFSVLFTDGTFRIVGVNPDDPIDHWVVLNKSRTDSSIAHKWTDLAFNLATFDVSKD